MPLEFLEKLGVSVYHPFHREALMAWWFVPPRYVPGFFKVLEHVWNHPEHMPRLQSGIFTYFRAIVPARSYHEFHGHIRALLKSRQIFFEEEDRLDLA